MAANQGRMGLVAAMLAAGAIWPLGSARPSFWACAGALLCYVMIVDLFVHRRLVQVDSPLLKAAAGLAGLLIVCAFVQAVPIAPSGLAHPAWETSAAALGLQPPGLAAISANPTATVRTSILGLVIILFALSGLVAGRRRSSAYLALDIVLASVTLAALSSLVLALFGNPFPWLADRWAYLDRPAGPFVNPNMFGYLCAAGVLISGALGLRAVSRSMGSDAGWRADIVDFFSSLAGRPGLYLISLLICAHALLATASRNALGSLAVSGLVALIAALLLVRGRHAGGLVLIAGVLVVVVVISPAGGLLAERVAWAAVDERVQIYADVETAVRANPLFGHGLGAFADAFPVYQSSFRPGGARVLYAHSSWLGLAFDLGLTGVIIGGVAAASAFGHFARQSLRRGSALDPLALGLISLTAVFGALDDPFQTPGAVFAVIFTVGVCAASQRRWRASG